MNKLHSKQEMIMEHLLGKPEGYTADELCSVLELTKTAVKEHLNRLEFLGFIHYVDRKGLIGRPRRFYSISDKGTETFPRQYSWLSTMLLEHLSETLSPTHLRNVLNALAEKTARPLMAQLTGMTTTDRLVSIGKVMNELGYKVQIKQKAKNKEVRIQAMNCVYHSVAKNHNELCQFDIRFLEVTSGMTVKLESCIAKGGASCEFCLK